MAYKNSLIGRHFKILQQLAIFQLEGLCTDAEFDMWKALGELGALMWYHEIKDMDSYLVCLSIKPYGTYNLIFYSKISR